MKNNRYQWLINLRWFAATGIILATFVSTELFHISLKEKQLYIVAFLLLLSNFIYFLIDRKTRDAVGNKYHSAYQRLIVAQILGDLVLLTILLHYSGGVENPFIIYYVFHLMLASILLSRLMSYFVASFTMLLVGLMAIGEFLGWFPHHPLTGFLTNGYYNNKNYLLGTGFVFVTTSYVVVYITSKVSAALRDKEQAYRQANLELLEKDKIKDEYVFRITHDIKGHLAAIQGCLEVMKISATKKEEFLKRAFNRTEKLLSFIEELLIITKHRLSKDIVRETFSLKKEVEERINDFSELIREKNLNVQSDLEAETLFADRISISEVLQNLISNSIKYTPDGGEIMIRSTVPKSKWIRLEVSDNGIGIPEDEIPDIFNEFFRANNTKNDDRENKGSGLGLAIVREIVRNHSGEIKVKSKLGVGTKLTIDLPQL